MATDDGVRWLMVRAGTRQIDRDAAARGRIKWTGDYWQGRASESWGPIETARYFTTAERDANPVWPGAGFEWVSVFVNVDPAEAGA